MSIFLRFRTLHQITCKAITKDFIPPQRARPHRPHLHGVVEIRLGNF